jgi:hypothetical protein
MKEYFEKVYIKNEDDLPKEDGYYFVSTGDKYDRSYDVFRFTKVNAKQNHLEWLEYIKFYLRPIEHDCYPKEFVEWCLLDVGKEYKSYNSDKLHYYTMPKTEEIWFESLDELYTYWKKEVRK